MAEKGLRILEVEDGALGREIGLAPGDVIVSIDGYPVPDEIALKFHLAEELVELRLLKAGGTEERIEVDLSGGRPLGIRVEDFRTRTCNNECLFCFIDQLPPEARPALRLKDDDYRLSFLYGNYVTLTNLPERELDRIIAQALSPLYVSVHATDPVLRARMLGRRKLDDLDRKMRKLIDGGIRLHTQVVLMPGINDGEHLEKTVADLGALHPGVDSVAIVPLGLSRHGTTHERFAPVTPAYCRKIIRTVSPWQERFKKETGKTFAYLADEFYIQGGVPLPEAPDYDEFAQIEDGIGMVRRFLDDFEREMQRRRKPRSGLRGTIATGTLFHPFLEKSIERFNARFGSSLRVVAVENLFMGRSITVAGLLGGRDIAEALRAAGPGDFAIVPHEAVSRVDGLLVDNLRVKDVERLVGRPVCTSGRTTRDFFKLLFERF